MAVAGTGQEKAAAAREASAGRKAAGAGSSAGGVAVQRAAEAAVLVASRVATAIWVGVARVRA